MIRANGYAALSSMETLRGLKMKIPMRAGSHWQGVPHAQLIDVIADRALKRNWEIDMSRAKLSLSKDGADMVGTIPVIIRGLMLPDGQSLSIGILNNNKLQRTLQILVGTDVWICENGCVFGRVVLAKKHTTGLELEAEIDGALNRYLEQASDIPEQVAQMQQRKLTDEEVDQILMRAGREGALPWSRIGQVDQEYRQPSFPAFEERNTWSLLNAFTHIVKSSSPLSQLEQMNQFRELLPVGESKV